MEYSKIMCFPGRMGPGNYDTIFNTDRYDTWEEAVGVGEAAVLDIVKDENDVKYIRIHTMRKPEENEYLRLDIQNFSPALGLDAMDDARAVNKAAEMLTKEEKEALNGNLQ